MRRVSSSKKWLLSALMGITLLAGCNGPTVFHSYHAVNPDGWRRGDTLLFEVPVSDTLHACNLELLLRYRNRYPYQNIGLMVRGISPDSSATVWKTNLTLVDSKGRWKGKGWGDLYQQSFKIGKLPNQRKGVYRIEVASCMNDSMLIGVNDIGVRVSLAPGSN